ncbi:hypothetical protein C8R45DRAFT_930591 [Mycena sanguinolenta]|nr:hypothetical protein C8R45DRAFT_930591 [Mycena sanguinolenta]
MVLRTKGSSHKQDLEGFGPYNPWQFLTYLPVFVDEFKPLGFQAATPSEQGLVKVLSRAIHSRSKQVLWPSAPQPFQLYPNSPITSVVALSSTVGHVLARAEGRWGATSLARGWSPDGEAAYRLVCYGNVVQIIHNALHVIPPHTVNVTRAAGAAHGGLAFGSTIAGRGPLKEQVRVVRLQDSILAWPDFDAQFPEPMRTQNMYGVWSGQLHAHCAEAAAWIAVRIRWLLLAAEAFGITIHSLSISVRRLAETNPKTERSYFQDLHDIKNEAQFWTLLAKARALQVCCHNCKEFVQQLIPDFTFVDVANVQLEWRRRDAISWFERRWGASRSADVALQITGTVEQSTDQGALFGMIQESREIRNVPIQRMFIFRSGTLAGRKRMEADELHPMVKHSDVQGPAWPESPGLGLALTGSGLEFLKPKPSEKIRNRSRAEGRPLTIPATRTRDGIDTGDDGRDLVDRGGRRGITKDLAKQHKISWINDIYLVLSRLPVPIYWDLTQPNALSKTTVVGLLKSLTSSMEEFIQASILSYSKTRDLFAEQLEMVNKKKLVRKVLFFRHYLQARAYSNIFEYEKLLVLPLRLSPGTARNVIIHQPACQSDPCVTTWNLSVFDTVFDRAVREASAIVRRVGGPGVVCDAVGAVAFERVSEDDEVLEWITIRARGGEGDSEDALDCKGAADDSDEGGDNHSLSRYSDFLLGAKKTVDPTGPIESLGVIKSGGG